ncbi:MAG: mechanosensitive ion channel [Clostridia bacterium]|nr:mechanosensitive ion channel [Clostridia bacterium]
MNEDMIKRLIDMLSPIAVKFAGKLVAAAVVLFVGFKISKFAVKLLKSNKVFSKLDANVCSFLASFLSIAIKAIVLITVAGFIGIPMTSFITILGSMAVAVGLSLQGSLSNIAGGIIVLIFKPFVIGDFISTDGVDGTVTDIGIFYTKLTTSDNKRIVIPNSIVSNNVLVNTTHQTTRRVDIDITVAYDTDVRKTKEILLNIANSHQKVLREPDVPMARLSAHGDNALVIAFRVWCNTDDYWDVRFDLLEAVKEEFDKNNISIPYPQLDVHLDK